MIRHFTFGVLATVVVLGMIRVPAVGDWGVSIVLAVMLAAWCCHYRLCHVGKLAVFLDDVNDEASQIVWPNGRQILHAAKVVVAFMTIAAISLCTLDLLTALCLETLRR